VTKPPQELNTGKHRVVLTSLEMCLDHPEFSKLLRDAKFTKNVLSIIVDEAHCVSQWGESFRKKYAELGKLRSYVPTSVPFLVTSATLPPPMLDEVLQKLCFSLKQTFIINLGNERLNITPVVCRLRGAARDLGALTFTIDDTSCTPEQHLQRTVIFFSSRDLTYKAYKHLQKLLPTDKQDQISFLHSGRTNRARTKVLQDFRDGKVHILCATEAAGMVSNTGTLGILLLLIC
jgi:superfamily II DNA helicase RecQ